MNSLRSFEWLIPPSLVERLSWVLVHSLWQFALVSLLAGVIVRTMRHNSAGARYGVLVAALGVSVAAPIATGTLLPGEIVTPVTDPVTFATEPAPEAALELLTDPLPVASGAIQPIESEVAGPSLASAGSGKEVELQAVAAPETLAMMEPEPSWSDRVRTSLRPWLAWIVAAWSIGVVVCSSRPLLGWHTLRRLRLVGTSPVPDEVQAAIQRISEQLGVRRIVRVFQSTLARVPVVTGYFRPVILLPASLFTNMPIAQLEAILAHELAHVRRHDFLVNLLQALVETLFFYHRGVWCRKVVRLQCIDRPLDIVDWGLSQAGTIGLTVVCGVGRDRCSGVATSRWWGAKCRAERTTCTA